jgi:flagellar hook-associated protein 1 FlgK
MTGTFSSFNTALSAIRYNQVVMDIASGNVANAQTEGYARRRAEGVTAGTSVKPALWFRGEGSGDGVRLGGITRMSDPFLTARARVEHGNQNYLDLRAGVLERIESGIGEPGDNGVSAAMLKFRQATHDLSNNPSSDAARSQFLASAESLANSINIQARNIEVEAGDQRSKLLSTVEEVNTVASDLASVNDSIRVAKLNGTDAGSLLDQRDLLGQRLAELTGAKGTVNVDGGLDLAVNGVALVTGGVAGAFEITTGVTPTGAADGNPVTVSIIDPTLGTVAVPGGFRGETGAIADLLNVTIPEYIVGLNDVASTLADEFNAQHVAGYDSTGAPGTALFSYNPANAASSLTVAITDRNLVAAAGVPGGVIDGENADAMAGLNAAEGAYQRLINGFGTEVASVRRLANNQSVLTEQVDGSRDQLSGVNLDEEMLNMVTAQRAYEAASKVISVMDSVLDTLINRTGLLR